MLNRAVWSNLALSLVLLRLLLNAFLSFGPVVIGIDETIERRRGEKIKAKGIYRDPVRSSKSHFVKASGLRWISLMLLVKVPWARRIWGLPFLTVLAPSERYYESSPRKKGKRLPTLNQVLTDQQTVWKTVQVQNWYGQGPTQVEIASDTAVWYHSGKPAVPIRWVLVRDPNGKFETKALLCTAQTADPIRFCNGSFAVGKSRSPSRKYALIWGSKPSASGLTKRLPGPRPFCWAYSPG